MSISDGLLPDVGIVPAALAGLCAAMVTAGVISVYAHRYVAHGAVQYLHPGVRLVMRTWIWTATGTNCRGWAALHIKHHRVSDRLGDPHSPQVASSSLRLGPVANWVAYRRAVADAALPDRFPPAHAAQADRWDRLVFDRSLLGVTSGLVVATVAVGITAGPVLWISQGAAYIVFTTAVNNLGHAWGYQRYSNLGARYTGNSVALALLTGGENLHNNHHGDPMSPFLARAWWEFLADWPSVLLLGLETVGLARLGRRRARHPPVVHPQLEVTARMAHRGRTSASGGRPISASRRRALLRQEEEPMLKAVAAASPAETVGASSRGEAT